MQIKVATLKVNAEDSEEHRTDLRNAFKELAEWTEPEADSVRAWTVECYQSEGRTPASGAPSSRIHTCLSRASDRPLPAL